ncbi:MAG: hypothetical protein H0W89_07940 [Candidatus Levybacteria bacterium]|nr:hypothetical protein [Candidatus Levybacteria bacterium]
MSKTSYTLIILLGITVILFLFFNYSHTENTKLPSLNQNAKSATSVAKTTLSLSPASQTLVAGETSRIGLFIAMQDMTPTTLQVEIDYDPSVLTPIKISPGTFFAQPVELINTINPRNGRISYALKCSSEVGVKDDPTCTINAGESVATIDFTVSPFAAKRESSFNVLPKTLIESKETSEVILQTHNAKVFIQGAVILQASPSAVVTP